MAVFGAPTAHEDDPERAVRAALAIREALAASNERNPELDLHVRIAVNTGEALVSLDANPAAGESIVSGDVVNTAARLQTAAPIDDVVVGSVDVSGDPERDRVRGVGDGARKGQGRARSRAGGRCEPSPEWGRRGDAGTRPDSSADNTSARQ